jgi:ribosomal silencing factor RsfS
LVSAANVRSADDILRRRSYREENEKHKDKVYIDVDGGSTATATMVTAAGAGCRNMLAFIQRKTA